MESRGGFHGLAARAGASHISHQPLASFCVKAQKVNCNIIFAIALVESISVNCV